MILVFRMLSFKPGFSLSSFTLMKVAGLPPMMGCWGQRRGPGGGGPSSAAGWGRPGLCQQRSGLKPLQVGTRAHPRPWGGRSETGHGPRAPGSGQQAAGPLPVLGLWSSGFDHRHKACSCVPVGLITGTKPAPGLAGEAEAEGSRVWGGPSMCGRSGAYPRGPGSSRAWSQAGKGGDAQEGAQSRRVAYCCEGLGASS